MSPSTALLPHCRVNPATVLIQLMPFGCSVKDKPQLLCALPTGSNSPIFSSSFPDIPQGRSVLNTDCPVL